MKEFPGNVLIAAVNVVGQIRCFEVAWNATSLTNCSREPCRDENQIPSNWGTLPATPSFFSRELLGPSWCWVIFKEPSSHCWSLTLVWMTPVPSITRPRCHRWRNNNRLNYPALHTWLNAAHCSPPHLQDGSLCAGSGDRSARWAQVVAGACPLLLHQRYSAKGCRGWGRR